MAEPLLTRAPTPGASPPVPPKAPGLVEAFVAVLTRPAEFYASLRNASGFAAPVVFALVMGIVSGVISAIYLVFGLGAAGGPVGGAVGAAAGFGMLVTTPFFAVIGCFVGGAVVHVISLAAGGRGTYEQSVRVAAYASAVAPVASLLGFVPFLRWLPALYGLYLAAQGLITIHAADRRKTWIATGILAAILIGFSIMGMMAGRAVQRMGSEVETKYGKGSDFQREIEKAQQEIQRAAEEMRRQQQAPPRDAPGK